MVAQLLDGFTEQKSLDPAKDGGWRERRDEERGAVAKNGGSSKLSDTEPRKATSNAMFRDEMDGHCCRSSVWPRIGRSRRKRKKETRQADWRRGRNIEREVDRVGEAS